MRRIKTFLKIEFFIYYLLKPKWILIFDKILIKRRSIDCNIVFVVPDGKSWILKGICEEISRRLPAHYSYKIVTLSKRLPKSDIYFFSHFMLYSRAFYFSHHVRNYSKNYVFYTHFEGGEKIRFRDLILLLKESEGILCMNSVDLNFLSMHIRDEKKLYLNIGAVDTKFFSPVNRLKNEYIGFSSSFYYRKNPDLILEIIKSNSNRKFKILGAGWEQYEKYTELVSLNNLKIVDTNYMNYPKEYQSLRLFISVSTIEGGPLPTLEALASNVFPIVTDTGFNCDVIVHGENGFLVNKEVEVSEITRLINAAWDIDYNVSQSVEKYSWDNVARNLLFYMGIIT